jgi:hypothetical protein
MLAKCRTLRPDLSGRRQATVSTAARSALRATWPRSRASSRRRGVAGSVRSSSLSSATGHLTAQQSDQDAHRRGLPALKPVLEALAKATKALRAADFNDNASK